MPIGPLIVLALKFQRSGVLIRIVSRAILLLAFTRFFTYRLAACSADLLDHVSAFLAIDEFDLPVVGSAARA